MPNQASYNVSVASVMADTQHNYQAASVFSPAGNKRADIIMDIDENGETLNTGQLAAVSFLVIKVVSGGDPPEGTVSFFADTSAKDLISAKVPQGNVGCLLVNPGKILAKCDQAGTIQIRVLALEQ